MIKNASRNYIRAYVNNLKGSGRVYTKKKSMELITVNYKTAIVEYSSLF